MKFKNLKDAISKLPNHWLEMPVKEIEMGEIISGFVIVHPKKQPMIYEVEKGEWREVNVQAPPAQPEQTFYEDRRLWTNQKLN